MPSSKFMKFQQMGEMTEINNNSNENTNLQLGNLKGYQVIKNEIDTAYNKIVKWERSIFELPRGKAGKDIIQELIRLMQLLNNKTTWESLSMDLVIIFLLLMLQKPSAKSKRKDHVRYFIKRLEMWKAGKIKDLVSECCTIQRRMLKSKKHRQESAATGFTRLMLQGKVKQALKLVNEDNNIDGVHTLTDEIRNILESKHPDPEPVENDNIQPNRNIVEEVIFEDIHCDAVKKAAKSTFGSGGPTKIDSEIWKTLLCSKAYGNRTDQLCKEIAIFT